MQYNEMVLFDVLCTRNTRKLLIFTPIIKISPKKKKRVTKQFRQHVTNEHVATNTSYAKSSCLFLTFSSTLPFQIAHLRIFIFYHKNDMLNRNQNLFTLQLPFECNETKSVQKKLLFFFVLFVCSHFVLELENFIAKK